MYKLIKQLLSFVWVSGIGWIMDFTIYMVLTTKCGFSVFSGNFLSAIPAITFVFFVSTRYVFGTYLKGNEKLIGYFSYFLYQMILLYVVSSLSQRLYNYNALWNICDAMLQHKKIIVKICITPITMLVNFVVLKGSLQILRKGKCK